MKKLTSTWAILFLVALLIPVETRGGIAAEFRIESWQPMGSEGEWTAFGWYEMTNTGDIEIGYHEVYFEATCEDNTRYTSQMWGPFNTIADSHIGKLGRPVYPGETYSMTFWIKTYGSKPVSVRIYDWKIRRYYETTTYYTEPKGCLFPGMSRNDEACLGTLGISGIVILIAILASK